jgi:hypothetical protein
MGGPLSQNNRPNALDDGWLSVGPPRSSYPVAPDSHTADEQINGAIESLSGAGGGVLYLRGGPKRTFLVSKTVGLREGVSVVGDGCVVKGAPGARVSPVVGNLRDQSLTNLSFEGFGIDANAANAGFIDEPVGDVTSGTFAYHSGDDQPRIVTISRGSVRSIRLNGRLTGRSAGALFVNHDDSLVVESTDPPSVAHRIAPEGWHTYNTQACEIRLRSASGGGPKFAGNCFVLDAGASQFAAQNIISIQNGSGWAWGMRYVGSHQFPTTGNLVRYAAFVGMTMGGVDVAAFADTNVFDYLNVKFPVGNVYPLATGISIGAPGTLALGAESQRQKFSFVTLGTSGNAPGSVTGLYLGYYQNDGGKSAAFPGCQVDQFNIGGPVENIAAVVTDGRAAPVDDYRVVDLIGRVTYGSGTAGGRTVLASRAPG